ncbi:MAG TPA: phage Gp37/Gp68 family protein [Anaerolineae bacterium]|nr:phage Gp37/Gp68 family protein [Anaerolineae bacterium]
MDKSKISWTDATWNFIVGCSRVSPGCEHCYAERLALRYGWSTKPWSAQNAKENVIIKENKLELPLKWKEPRRIFVNSLSDLFHEQVPDVIIDRAFAVMALCPQHTFQILTKRPMRMLEYFSAGDDLWGERWVEPQMELVGECEPTVFPLRNVWLGVSVEDQRRADERIPLLLQTPAAVRFLSCEPLLGEIDLLYQRDYLQEREHGYYDEDTGDPKYYWEQDIHWVIVGGESGPNFRPMNLDWARSIRDQCVAADVPFFFKQQSGIRSEMNPTLDGVEWHQYPKEDE